MDKDREEAATSALPGAPKFALRLIKQDVTARSAVRVIAVVTITFAFAGGLLMRVFDEKDFHTIGQGLWFSLQTVTTVGYGDVVPTNTLGRLIAAIVMLAGIGFISVITAAVTASLVESARRGPRKAQDDRVEAHLEDISARLAAIEAKVSQRND